MVVNVTINEPFTITLQSYAHGGYLWEFVPPQSSPEFVLENQDVAPLEDDGFIGSGGDEQFHFCGLETGSYTARFFLKRPWVKEIEEILDVTVNVIVPDDLLS